MTKAGYIAIIGRPNSGKSTLLNSVLGSEISIVTPKAQTTREKVLGILTMEKGQIIFIDTPGIHKAKSGGLNQYMVTQAQEALESPDLIWYLVDPFSNLTHESVVIQLLERTQAPIFLLINKIDYLKKKLSTSVVEKLEKSLVQDLSSRNIQIKEVLRISAFSAKENTKLIKESWKYIPEGPLFYSDLEQLSDRPVRFFVAEKIREQLFHSLGEEIPYSCAVMIDEFDESKRMPHIQATIFVERESQKGMVIGKGGKKIKEIGQLARTKIEDFLAQRIFLGLKVKVLKDWSRDSEELSRLGYTLPSRRKVS